VDELPADFLRFCLPLSCLDIPANTFFTIDAQTGLRSGSEPPLSDGRTRAAAAIHAVSRRRDREDVRAQIVAAARRLLDRTGAPGFTLSAVAGEAGLARATIYAHFSSRQNLLSQLSAPAEQPNGAEQVTTVDHAAPAEQIVSEETPEPLKEAAAELVADGSEQPDSPQPEGGFHDVMRAQAEALDELAKRVIVPKSLRREGTDAAISRVEARLSVAEQSNAALERSVGEKLRIATSEAAALAASLEDTRRRLEKFEERQQAAIAQLRLDVHNLYHRDGEVAPATPAEPETSPEQPVDEEPPAPGAGDQIDAEVIPARVQPYLSSARQAAINAARQAVTTPKPSRASPKARWLKRWCWPLIVAAALLVAVFDIFVFLRYQPAKAEAARAMPAVVVQTVAKPRMVTPEVQLARGLRLLNGTGVAMNVEKAAVWLERAAANGNAVAQNYVGVLYQTGTGVHANMATAMRWYEAAARNGNLKAMTNLGKAYAGGWAEGADFTKAAEWFGRAAGFGEVDAQFDLAILYERGEGVSRSIPEAYKWYVIAGARGDANAASRALVLASALSPNELLAAQAAAALFRPAKADSTANDAPR
jgi:TPR repeat protein